MLTIITPTTMPPKKTKELRCSDFGVECPAVFRANSVDEVLEQAKKHGVAMHGQTKEQAATPEVRAIAEKATREIAP